MINLFALLSYEYNHLAFANKRLINNRTPMSFKLTYDEAVVYNVGFKLYREKSEFSLQLVSNDSKFCIFSLTQTVKNFTIIIISRNN